MVRVRINGTEYELDVDADMPLLWALRDHAGLTGTKYGCGKAQCGACTVHLDGQPVRSCVIPVSSVAGRSITTIEGLDTPHGQAVRQAWVELQVPQCGFCQSGQIMTAAALIAGNPEPTDDDINTAMDGNICRCASYQRIREGVKLAARRIGGED